jgi:ribulose-bisphosphate carboxylase large chain
VERLTALETVSAPSLPGAVAPKAGGGWQRAEVELSWPIENIGASLPNLLATVAGNLFELKQFSGLRLLDLVLPEEFRDTYPGPQFGVAGTRRLAGVNRLPLVGTIVKPSVGLSPQETATLVKTLAEAGIDFIKDDELQADGPHCPFEQRVQAVMRVLREHAARTGKMVMYAFNLTGEVDEMRARHDVVAANEGTFVMASLHSIGLAGLTALRRYAGLPIHAHRNGWGIYARSPHMGVSYVAWQKLWRLAGADHLHVNGLRNKFCESDESVVASARACLSPMFAGPGRGCEVMPVFSSGQWAGQAFDTYAALGSTDLIHAAGGGIMAHPMGVAAGVASIRQAWEAAMQGRTLEEASRDHAELRAAVEAFGQ